MPDPITLQQIAQPVRPIPARADLTPEQLVAFQQLLGSSGLLSLPEGKSVTDIVQFTVAILPIGKAIVQVSIK